MECPEAVERGRNFRLLAEEELSKLLDFLTRYLPDSLKVRIIILRTIVHFLLLINQKYKCLYSISLFNSDSFL